MKVLLTGASGFVGKAILKTGQERGLEIRSVYRSIGLTQSLPDSVFVPTLDGATDWTQALQGIDVVIHAAARAHILREESHDPLAEYRRVNVDGTLNLVRQSASAGVRRFVFMSSIKVNGENTTLDHLFSADDPPAPDDPYGISKTEAEAQLNKVAKGSGMEATIIRAPLIYGPGVKGNLGRLISALRRGLPLPLGAVTQNRRSLVGLDNLVDLILICTHHANAANQIFLVCDGEDLSTTDLLRKIGKALGRPARLYRVPVGLLALLADLMGQKAISQRVLGSLRVDMRKTCELLGWAPSISVDEGLARAVE